MSLTGVVSISRSRKYPTARSESGLKREGEEEEGRTVGGGAEEECENWRRSEGERASRRVILRKENVSRRNGEEKGITHLELKPVPANVVRCEQVPGRDLEGKDRCPETRRDE